MIRQDGHLYNNASEVPDMGTIVCTSFVGKLRNYAGLLSDKDKLPVYDDLKTGSTASLVSDDGISVFMYESTTKKWYG